MKWVSFFLCLLFLSCTASKREKISLSPEQRVKEFIELSAGAKQIQDKGKLEALCRGEMRNAFSTMTEEAFKITYLTNDIRLLNLEILKVKVEEDKDEAEVQYRVKVRNESGTQPSVESSERVIWLKRSEGEWFLENISTTGKDSIVFTEGMIF